MRLNSFDYFRGIAILLIVAGHSYGPWVRESFLDLVLANLITGGTALFVFISGFFFHYIFYSNFNYKDFLLKKTKYVMFPYVALSGIALYIFIAYSIPVPDIERLAPDYQGTLSDNLKLLAIYLWTGKTAVAYWYIPFIFIMFVLSPLFIRYIKLSPAPRLVLLLVWLVAAMFIQRPAGNESPLHSVLYFTPVYMLGICCSISRETVLDWVEGKAFLLGALVLGLAAFQALFFHSGNFHKEGVFTYAGVDVILIQKVAMCFFFLSVLHKYETMELPLLKVLAASSFAIFFLHPWVLRIAWEARLYSFVEFIPGMGVFLLSVPLVIICSYLVAFVIKTGLNTRSRYLVGW